MIIKNKIIAKLISAILIATLALPSVAFASDENSNNNEFQNYNLNVQFHQTLARKHAEMLNDFRTSDTWYWNEDNTTKTQVSGLNELTYDYDLEQIAMQRAAELLFRYSHERPDDTYTTDLNEANKRYIDGVAYQYIDPDTLIISSENIDIKKVFSGNVDEDLEETILNAFKEENYKYSGQGHRRNMLEPSHKVFAVAHASYGGLHTWVHLFGTHNDGSTYTEPLDSTRQMTVKVKKSLIFDDSNIDYSKQAWEIAEDLPSGTGSVHIAYNYEDIVENSKRVGYKYYKFLYSGGKNAIVIPNDRFFEQTYRYPVNTPSGEPTEDNNNNNNNNENNENIENNENEDNDENRNVNTNYEPYLDPDMEYKDYTIDVEYNQSRARRHADLINQFRTSNTWQYDENNNRVEVRNRQALIYDYGLEKCAMQRAAEIIFRYGHSRPDNNPYDTVYGEILNRDIIEIGGCGENIGALFYKHSATKGISSEADMLEKFEEEDSNYSGQGHRRNMLYDGYRYYAVGCIRYDDEDYYVQWFSSDPSDLTYSEPVDSTRTATIRVMTALIDNDETVRRGWMSPGRVVIPRKESELSDPSNTSNPDDHASSISVNTIKSTYKTKTDISSLIPTPGAVKTKYKSSSKKIAKVNKKGIVTGGKKAGTATITKYVKYDKKSPWEEAGSVTIQNYYPKLPKKQTLSVGSTLSMNSLLTGMDETPIKWESSKPSVATISENGMVIALQKGTAKLTPVFSSGKAKVKTTIKVK